MDSDLELALRLQTQFNQEEAPNLPSDYISSAGSSKLSPVDAQWETIDPTPDLHGLFIEFNKIYFWGKLVMCEVRWSPRMTTCAGICRYQPRAGFCTIGISTPLLKLRPRKDLVETLLHEMIHAYLFVTDNNTDRDGHGPEFHKHMYRINAATGASISVYHTFHDEVALYKQHWWRCSGPCTKRPPFYGFVKRATNRAPGPNDRWWNQHSQSCGGTFTKVKEPEGFGEKKGKKVTGIINGKENSIGKGHKDIRGFMGNTNSIPGKPPKPNGGPMPKGLLDANEVRSNENLGGGGKPGVSGVPVGGGGSESGPTVRGGGTSRSGGGTGASGGGGRGNIFGFGGTSFSGSGGGGLKTRGKSGTVVVKPGRPVPDNSSGGSVVSGLELPSDRYEGAAGYRLGSGQGVNSSQKDSVRDAVRDRWANKDSSSSSGPKSNTNKNNPGSSGQKSNVIKDNFSSSRPNLQVNKDDSSKVNSSSSGQRTNVKADKEFLLVACPICDNRFSSDSINSHLDVCLSAQKAGDNVEESFDGDDDELLAATIDLEKSLNEAKDKSSNGSKITISDSDDDDIPLVKKPRKPEEDDPEDLFGDLTAQDDLDILAALEDTANMEGVNSSMFACPICDNLVDHQGMNQHLEKCLM